MKKIFVQPIVEIEKFEIEDVITTSGGPELDDNEGGIDVGG